MGVQGVYLFRIFWRIKNVFWGGGIHPKHAKTTILSYNDHINDTYKSHTLSHRKFIREHNGTISNSQNVLLYLWRRNDGKNGRFRQITSKNSPFVLFHPIKGTFDTYYIPYAIENSPESTVKLFWNFHNGHNDRQKWPF